MYWNAVLLVIAILFEVVATSALKLTNGFTNLVPSLVAVSGYALAFYFLSLTLRTMPVGIVYALWSGVGIVFVTTIGWAWFRQSLDMPALVGMGFIIVGVAIINLFSKTLAH